MSNNIYNILKTSTNFTSVMTKINESIAGEAHCLEDLAKMNNKKVAGDLWEGFCIYYLRATDKYKIVCGWNDFIHYYAPPNIPKITDHGIDIVCITPDDKYVAVQCKYRHRPTGVVTWRELSTFYSLALKLGIFIELIVMTSGRYVKYITKLSNERSICYSSFNKLNSLDFLKWIDSNIEVVNSNVAGDNKVDIETLRKLRLSYFT